MPFRAEDKLKRNWRSRNILFEAYVQVYIIFNLWPIDARHQIYIFVV